MAMIATIDSGAEAGCSLWDGSTLYASYLIRTKDLFAWHIGTLSRVRIERTVIEIPIFHSEGRSKVSPNTLIKLGLNAGRLLPIEGDVETIYPVTWKGSLPDGVLYPWILGSLSADERSLIPDLPKSTIHNVLDSIGIGLHTLGRLKRS